MTIPLANVIGPNPGVNLSQVDTTPQFQLGMPVNTTTGKYIYVQAAQAISDNMVVNITDTFTVKPITKLVAQQYGRVGIMDGGGSAIGLGSVGSGSYAWCKIEGVGLGNVLASCQQAAALYTSATDGALDDAKSASGTTYALIKGAVLTASVGASAAPGIMQLGPAFVDLP